MTVATEQWVDRYVLSTIASFPYKQNMIIGNSYDSLPTSEHVRYLADVICRSQLAYSYYNRNNLHLNIYISHCIRVFIRYDLDL